MINSIYKYGKSIFLWVLVKENRNKGLQYIKKLVESLSFLAEISKNQKDDKVIKQIEDHLKSVPSWLAQDVIKQVNETKKGPMKNLNIEYDQKKGINAGLTIKF